MNKLVASASLIPEEDVRRTAPMRRSAKDHLLMRSPKSDRDWFKIKNKKDSDKGTDVTEIYIYDEIGLWGTTAREFVEQVTLIDTAKIDLHLNSPGGEIFDGVAIYNALQSHKAEVTVYIDALAASAASFIAQAGDKVIMTRNATMMIHDGIGICIGNAKDMQDTADVLNKLSDNIASIYADRAGGEIEEWRDLMREEVWYNAQEAVDASLADEVAGATEEDVSNSWDFSIFNYAGRDDAPSPSKVRERVLTNRAKKEAPVTTKNTRNQGGQGQPGTEGQPAGTEEPPAGTEGQPAGTEEPPAGTEEPPAGTEEPPATGAQVPANRATGTQPLMVNGSPVSDPSQVQAHITALETFRDETRDSGRKSFVQQLAQQNKIAATQVSNLEEFVLTLTDSQYEKWMASWDAAASLPLLESHAGGSSNHNGSGQNREAENAAEIETYKGIVRQHKLANMPEDQIKKTNSYQKLLELDPDFKL